MTHFIKIAPCYFNDVKNEDKTFELRKNDRDYKAGDTVVLQEWTPDLKYTGRAIIKHVPYVLYGGILGLDKDYCILSLEKSEICTYLGICPHRLHNGSDIKQ